MGGVEPSLFSLEHLRNEAGRRIGPPPYTILEIIVSKVKRKGKKKSRHTFGARDLLSMSPLPRISPSSCFPLRNLPKHVKRSGGAQRAQTLRVVSNRSITNGKDSNPPPVRVKQVDKERGGFDPTPSASKQVDDQNR